MSLLAKKKPLIIFGFVALISLIGIAANNFVELTPEQWEQVCGSECDDIAEQFEQNIVEYCGNNPCIDLGSSSELKDSVSVRGPNSDYTDEFLASISNGVYENNSYTSHLANGITVTNTGTYVDSVDYSGGSYSGSGTAYVVPANESSTGEATLHLNSTYHYEHICSNCTIYEKSYSWIMTYVEGIEPATHGIDLEFFLQGNQGVNHKKFSELSNGLNASVSDAKTKYPLVKTLKSSLPGLNKDLKDSIKNYVDSIEMEEALQTDLYEAEDDIEADRARDKSETNSEILGLITNLGASQLTPTELSKILEGKIETADSQLQQAAVASINNPLNVASLQSSHQKNIQDVLEAHDDSNVTNLTDYQKVNERIEVGDYIAQPDIPDVFVPPQPLPEDPVVTPLGNPLKTQASNPNYSKLVDAISYYDAVDSQVAPGSDADHLVSLSAIGIELADNAYSTNDSIVGDSFLGASLSLLDAAIDFVPGLSLVKDSVSIVTGVNPVTGESLSATERTVLLGTLFVPAALSGSAKAVTKTYKVLKDISDRGGKLKPLADDLKTSIETSGESLRKYSLSATPKPSAEINDEILERFSTSRKRVEGELPLTGKKVAALNDTKPGEYYPGVEKTWGFSSKTYRDNMKRLIDPDLPSSDEAHHMFPQNLRNQFREVGIHIDDPRVMVPFPNGRHQSMHQGGDGLVPYNDAWEEWLLENRGAISYDDVLNKAHSMATDYGFSDLLTGYF